MYLNYQTKTQTNLLLSIKFWILTLALVLIYATLIFAQNVVHIDPTNQGDPLEDGSFDHPFDSWSDIIFVNNTTYLQKRGTISYSSSYIDINSKDNITMSAYGEGVSPEIIYSGGGNLVAIGRSSHCTIENLKLTGDLDNTTSLVAISGHWSSGGGVANNNTVINCELSYAYNGVRALPYQTDIDTISVINCNIHHIREDGVFIGHCDKITVKGCNIWHINLDWHLDGHTQDESPGDCIQIGGDSDDFLIENNIMDRRYTGNKFCFIWNGAQYNQTATGKIIGNTFYPPKDTATGYSGGAIYLKQGSYVEIAYNKFIGRDYQWGGTPTELMHCEFQNVDFYYNLVDNISGLGSSMNCENYMIFNNTFIGGQSGHNMIFLNGVELCESKNNIFALNDGVNIYVANGSTLVEDSNRVVIGNPGNWGIDPGFVDWQNQNYKLIENSPCKNTGYDYSSYFVDLDSVLVPQENIRDIGSYEYYAGGQ
ncbi:MAG: hypothetical protein K8R37_14050, partial [Bacteroidales bacterium]|nr:hypothetical protein [Bacteroidales bacterium]